MIRHARVVKNSQGDSPREVFSLWAVLMSLGFGALFLAEPGGVFMQADAGWASLVKDYVTDLPNGTLAALVGGLVGISAMSFSLITQGKQGWGWFAICVLGAILLLTIKAGTSLFLEVSSSVEGPSDWDED